MRVSPFIRSYLPKMKAYCFYPSFDIDSNQLSWILNFDSEGVRQRRQSEFCYLEGNGTFGIMSTHWVDTISGHNPLPILFILSAHQVITWKQHPSCSSLGPRPIPTLILMWCKPCNTSKEILEDRSEDYGFKWMANVLNKYCAFSVLI